MSIGTLIDRACEWSQREASARELANRYWRKANAATDDRVRQQHKRQARDYERMQAECARHVTDLREQAVQRYLAVVRDAYPGRSVSTEHMKEAAE